MEPGFGRSVETGLELAKRLNNLKNRSVSAPKPVDPMHESPEPPPNYIPTSPMVYAVISDPGIVDNPDRSSYQPNVHGRCNPPALIPLQMNEIEIKFDSYLDSVFVDLTGSWRVHCVSGNQRSDCRLVIPMGEKGSILGVEIDVTGRSSYSTRLTKMEEKEMKKTTKKEGGLLTPQLFTLTVPQVDGGSVLSIKVSWFQQLLCIDGLFSLSVPFNFPEYITPSEKGFLNREKIKLNLNPGAGKEVLCKTSSHPLKEIRRQVGKLDFVYEAEGTTWSTTDFYFSYVVLSTDIFGGLVVQTPSVHDFDQREMFCLYLFTGTENNQNRKVFRKDVVFLVDISASMRARPLENVKRALSAALSRLTPADSFNIIAFNGETRSFSGSLELASKEMVGTATQWMSKHFIAGGGTNLLHPLKKAMEMLSNTRDSVPHIFLITDGSVDDEQNICHTVKTHLKSRGSLSPRISTFGIGSYCNHYFLRMLASIGRGRYDAAYDSDSINVRIQRLFTTSAMLRNITIDAFEHLDAFEVYPSHIPDLLLGSPSIVYGRYQGNFPDTIKAKGILADMTDFSIDLKVQKAKDIPLDKDGEPVWVDFSSGLLLLKVISNQQ